MFIKRRGSVIWITIFLITLSISITSLYLKLKKEKDEIESKLASYNSKYSDLIGAVDINEKLNTEKIRLEGEISNLKKEYVTKRELFESIVKETAIYSEEIEIAEWGFYKPQYQFDTSEQFKNALEENRKKQKLQLDKELSALKSSGTDSKSLKLPDYAFNRACDAAISNVRWNNASKMEERIKKAYEFVNKNSNGIRITTEVLNLKLEELRLTHEYALKKQEEKEEQAAIRQRMKEDAQLEIELKRAQLEEEKYQKLLEKAKKEALANNGEKEKELRDKISALTRDLEEAQEKTQRAKSLAEQTRAGHIYIISNKGSFGEHVYKVGMTRRADPQERIDELGDASVPFTFDVHAFIYTDDAPTFEKTLHSELDAFRVNLVNNRKEFFKIDLVTIQNIVRAKFKEVEFNLTAEAREYMETCALRAIKENKNMDTDIRSKFPKEI
jgi:hypothetical protein